MLTFPCHCRNSGKLLITTNISNPISVPLVTAKEVANISIVAPPFCFLKSLFLFQQHFMLLFYTSLVCLSIYFCFLKTSFPCFSVLYVVK
nr:MAG TPA: hypothetical protein [Caudoviricetes sp.]